MEKFRYAQLFLSYILSTKLSFRIDFSSASRAHSITRGFMMNRRQL